MTEHIKDICSFRTERVKAQNIGESLYISTENMFPNKAGVSGHVDAALSGTVSRFFVGDILVSNIRPYFKKIWKTNKDGYCSNDVLVFKPDRCSSSYLYWILSDDRFFEYVMSTSKGTKMPRGDKAAIMDYSIPSISEHDQEIIVTILNSIQDKITLNNRTNDYLAACA